MFHIGLFEKVLAHFLFHIRCDINESRVRIELSEYKLINEYKNKFIRVNPLDFFLDYPY